jgi:hypothetical protein
MTGPTPCRGTSALRPIVWRRRGSQGPGEFPKSRRLSGASSRPYARYARFRRAAPPGQPRHRPVARFGAVGDGRTLNTASIQDGIDKLSASGGGSLVIPEGVFLSGALFLKTGVELHLDKGAVLKGSTHIDDYPKANFDVQLKSERFDHQEIDGLTIKDVKRNGKPY